MHKDPLTLVGKLCGLVHRCAPARRAHPAGAGAPGRPAIWPAGRPAGVSPAPRVGVGVSLPLTRGTAPRRRATRPLAYRVPGLLPLVYTLLKQNGVHDLFIIGLVLAVPIVIGIFFVAFIELVVVPEKRHQA